MQFLRTDAHKTSSLTHSPDNFSLRLGYATELAQSLVKLQVQNLSSMDADWMYSSYHYSHPILTERLKAIGWTSERKVTGDKGIGSNGGAGKPVKVDDIYEPVKEL